MANKGIDPQLKFIKDYLNVGNDAHFVIPEYQRAYSWNIYQCDKLWQDIESYLEEGKKDPYFFGTVILDCSSDNGELHLIDGQQRTTTFLLLLKALYFRLQETLKVFVHTNDSEALEDGIKENRNAIVEILYKADRNMRVAILNDWNLAKGRTPLVNKSINEQYKNELCKILDAKSYDEAEALCYKIPRKQKDNKYTNFFKNFKFFYTKLGYYKESQLNRFADGFLCECQVIEIRSWQTEQAITMFNSLNSTGLPLSDADIISARLYSNSSENRACFNAKWMEIVNKTSELAAVNVVNLDTILQQYMYIYRAQSQEYITVKEDGKLTVNVTMPGVRTFYISEHDEILTNPLKQCENFSKIVMIWDKIKDYPEVRLLLKFNDNARTYLVAYLYRYNLSDIQHEVVADICELLLRLFTILELVDAGYSSANFKTFLFAEIIKMVDITIPFEQIKSDFDNHIRKIWTEKEIREEVLDYNKNILVFLNEYLYAKVHAMSFEFADNVNVEHIMPASGHNIEAIRLDAGIQSQEEFDSVANMLGNKILLEEDINKSIGKEWFETKKQKSIQQKLGYKNSKYPLASALSNYPSKLWTKTDIETATNKVATRLCDFIFGLNITQEEK